MPKRSTPGEQKDRALGRWDNEGGAAAPKRPKRPADVIGTAVRVAQIGTGEAEEEYEEPKPEKNAAAAELGRKGGAARQEPGEAGGDRTEGG